MREQDFERLYEEHAGPLLAFLAYRIGDRDTAEDLLSETFERVLRARRRFDPRKATEKTWLYTIALNCLRNRLRSQAREGRGLARVSGERERQGADPLERVEQREMLARALEALSDEEREAIALRFGADLTVPEIAKITGNPLARVEGRVYRGLRKLRAALE